MCFVLVMLSATTLVSNESIAPNSAKVNAVNIYGVMLLKLKLVKISKLGIGNPLGISSIGL